MPFIGNKRQITNIWLDSHLQFNKKKPFHVLPKIIFLSSCQLDCEDFYGATELSSKQSMRASQNDLFRVCACMNKQ